MARFEEIKYTPLSHEYELHFSALLRDLTHELDQMLDGYGGLHPVNDAPPVIKTRYWPGADVARFVSIAP